MTLQFLSYIGTGIVGLKIFTLVAFAAILIYKMKEKGLSKDNYPKPLFVASLFFFVSFTLTLLFSGGMHAGTVVANIGTYFVFPFIFWKCLDSKVQVLRALNILLYLMTFAITLGLIELILQHNYIHDLIESIFVIEDFTIDASSIRFGLKRCNSFFSYFTTYGVVACFSFVIFYVQSFYLKYRRRALLTIMIYLTVFAAFSTGSRAIFLGLFASVFCLFFNMDYLKHSSGRIMILILLLFSPLILNIGFQVLDSIFNSDNSKFAEGSSSDLRLVQWYICLPYFENSPLVGNGRMYIWDVVKEENFELLGAESIWFSILVDYGLIGAFAFLSLIISCLKVLYKWNKRLICLPVAYLLILSLSPDQGVQYNILLTFTILLLRMYQFLDCRTYLAKINQ